MARTLNPARFTLTLERLALLTTLQRLGRLVPARTVKPILSGVRLEAAAGRLRLATTDLETSLVMQLPAAGRLPCCVVPCRDLVTRLKSGRAEQCTLAAQPVERRLVLNGGAVEHTLATLDPAEFPAIPRGPRGKGLTVRTAHLREALDAVRLATARENTRYALTSLLLEREETGMRLVATDGRRMAVCELQAEGEFKGRVLLPRPVVDHLLRLLDPQREENVAIRIAEPGKEGAAAHVHVRGRDWRLMSFAGEGTFPAYRDVMPASASRFAVDREAFIGMLQQVAVATNDEHRGVQLELCPDHIRFTVATEDGCSAHAEAPAVFQGGGDRRILTSFFAPFLIEAARSLRGPKIVFDVAQNRLDKVGDAVRSCPALMYAAEDASTRWVVMPVSLGLKPSPETLGSNFEAPRQSGRESPAASVEAA